MAKRFTDTELSDKEWFMKLSCRLKCVVRYLFDKCDNAGVWTTNYALGAIYVGEVFTEEEILKIDGGCQFEKFGNKIFVKGFICFQYGELKESCHPHRPIISKLIKYGLYDKVILGYCKGTDRVQEKDKEEDKDKDFGKSENLLVPGMLLIWHKENPDYPIDKNKDSEPLFKIAKFICLQSKIEFNAAITGGYLDEIFAAWKAISGFIGKDNFYKNYSLQQVERHIQAISQSIKNCKNGISKKSGKSAGAYELAARLKNEIFSEDPG